MGDLRRLDPVSVKWGYDRGTPIDRFYIDRFLSMHIHDVHGRCLEMGDAAYTRRFGGDKVSQVDVLHRCEGNPGATIIGDLTDPALFEPALYDCVIATQVLQYVFDLAAAMETLHRILRPGGVVLATLPCITPIEQNEWDGPWHWSFTPVSARRLFETRFSGGDVTVHSRGNVLAATAFLQGLAAEELQVSELEHSDARFPMLACVRAVKPAAT